MAMHLKWIPSAPTKPVWCCCCCRWQRSFINIYENATPPAVIPCVSVISIGAFYQPSSTFVRENCQISSDINPARSSNYPFACCPIDASGLFRSFFKWIFKVILVYSSSKSESKRRIAAIHLFYNGHWMRVVWFFHLAKKSNTHFRQCDVRNQYQVKTFQSKHSDEHFEWQLLKS